MPYLVPIALVALGGAGLGLIRETRAVLALLLVQWLGLAWATAVLGVGEPGVLGLNTGSLCELITALTCVAVLALKPGFKAIGRGTSAAEGDAATGAIAPAGAGQSGPHPVTYLLAGASVLLAGVAGFALSSAFPLAQGGEAGAAANLIFYWTALSGAVALVLEGSRSPVKLTVGLVALLNSANFLINVLSVQAPSPAVLGLMAATRIGLSWALAYGWALLIVQFRDFSLDPLFASKEEWMAGPEGVGEDGPPRQLPGPAPVIAPPSGADPH